MTDLRMTRMRSLRSVFALVAALPLLAAGKAQAGSVPQSLGDLPGQSGLQQALGMVIETALIPELQMLNGGSGPDPGSDAERLLNEFNALSSAAQGDTSRFAGPDEVNEALNSIATRQAPAIGKQVSEIAALQAGVISDRLFALREGTASGVQLAGTLLDSRGNFLPLDGSWFDDAAAGEGGGWIPGLGVYATLEGGFGDRNENSNEAGFDFRTVGFTIGTDYRVADPFVVGLAFTYANNERDFDRNGGELETNSYTASLYGSATVDDFYLDAILSLGGKTIDSDRNIVYTGTFDTAKGETDAFEVAFAGTTGYQFNFALAGGNLGLGPVLRGEYRRLDIDGFRESGSNGFDVSYGDDEIESATIALGGEIFYAFSTDFGVITPQVGVEWEHQFADDPRNISVRVIADPSGTQLFLRTRQPDRNYANLSAGVSAALQGGLSAFFNYETLLAHERIDSHLFKIGLRGEF